ncbi:MAG: Stp1/IreP family PP2C-type Ser/Thr phosphatase [Methylophilaceae bacterium]
MDVTSAIEIARMSDVGLIRDHNEDAVASDLSIGLVILADGMGGYKAGEIASEIAVLAITAELAEAMQRKQFRAKGALLPESEMLTQAVNQVNQAIYQISQQQPKCRGMGTTLVAGLFTDNQLIVGHIGDSRMYRLRNKTLVQLTQDHSFLQAQIDAGEITAAQAKHSRNKNLVTRALGIDPEVELEVHQYETAVKDIYLLCSDGLTDLVSNEEIRIMLIEADVNIEHAAVNLIHFANDKGGKDNISVIIARVRKTFALRYEWVNKLLGKI